MCLNIFDGLCSSKNRKFLFPAIVILFSFCCEFILNSFQDSLHRSVILLEKAVVGIQKSLVLWRTNNNGEYLHFNCW
jgi:hypothetical protein